MRLIRTNKTILPKFRDDRISNNNSINAHLFMSFLRKEKSLDMFKKYWKDEYFFDKVNKENFLLGAFDWKKTKEGIDFWADLNNKWGRYISSNEYTLSVFDRYSKERKVYGYYRRAIKNCDMFNFRTRDFCGYDVSHTDIKYNDYCIYNQLNNDWEIYYEKYVLNRIR